MTGNIGPHMKPPQGYPKPAKNDHEAGTSGTAHGKPNPAPAQACIDWDRLATTGRGDFGPAHTPGQEAPVSLRGRPGLPSIPEEGSASGSSGPDSRHSGSSSGGSGASMMNEILGKLGGNWDEIRKDLGSHEEYEKACDRNPFIKAHLDPDIESPRAGRQKDHWLERPGPDLPGGSTLREGGEPIRS